MKPLISYIKSLFTQSIDPLKKPSAERKEKPSSRRIISLEEYNSEIAKCILPTEEETEWFILSKLANDHSWYKHLTEKEDAPFYFFLDPNAGVTITDFKDGKYILKNKFKRPDVKPRIRWRYYTTAPYTLNLIKYDGTYSNSNDLIGKHWLNEEGEPAILSDEILEQGKFMLSRYIHNCFRMPSLNGEHIEYKNYHIDLGIRLKVFLMGLMGVEIDKDKPFVSDKRFLDI